MSSRRQEKTRNRKEKEERRKKKGERRKEKGERKNVLKRRFLVAALCRNDKYAVCHSIFARSLARSSFNGPHGMSLTHAACDQPLMNSPITKLKFCHSERSEESPFVVLRSFRSVGMTMRYHRAGRPRPYTLNVTRYTLTALADRDPRGTNYPRASRDQSLLMPSMLRNIKH